MEEVKLNVGETKRVIRMLIRDLCGGIGIAKGKVIEEV